MAVSTLRAILVFAALLIFTLALLPIQLALLRLGHPLARSVPIFWHRRLATLLGLKIKVRGVPVDTRPLLIAANHSSWLDIIVISTLAEVSFIAKSEVGRWPGIGPMSKLQRTVFVNRERRSETGKVGDQIGERLRSGDVLVLFAEGTSSTGNQILPFKTALFGALDKALQRGDGSGEGGSQTAFVQPLTIAYTRLSGLPMGRQFRANVAWYGDMSLAPHLWRILKEGAIDVECVWGPAIAYDEEMSRKSLARQCEKIVRRNMSALLTTCFDETVLGCDDPHKNSDLIEHFETSKEARPRPPQMP